MHSSASKFPISGLLVLATLLIPGCQDDEPAPIVDSRQVTEPSWRHSAGHSSSERFGNNFAKPTGDGAHTGEGHDSGSTDVFSYALPAGWEALAPTQFRWINLRVAAHPEVECTVSAVGGGLAGNVNRWRGQFGLGPLSDEQLDALPLIPMFGRDAHMLEIEGAYTGMGNTATPGSKLLGALIPAPQGQVIVVKMTGPAEIVTAETDAFKALCASLGIKPQPGEGAADSGTGHVHTGGDSAGGAHGSATPGPAMATGGADTGFDPAAVDWLPPEHWKRGRGSSLRLVTFIPGDAEDTQCWITVLPGPAGGVAANQDMWCEQVGRARYTPEERAALPTLQVLGQECQLVEAMGGDQTILGVASEVAGHSVFIKMQGPAAVVAGEKENFTAFCESLRYQAEER